MPHSQWLQFNIAESETLRSEMIRLPDAIHDCEDLRFPALCAILNQCIASGLVTQAGLEQCATLKQYPLRDKMKVLQTLGAHACHQAGIFQYRRTAKGVYIDGGVGQARLMPSEILISSREWEDILTAIQNASDETFRLTGIPPFPQPPNGCLYKLLSDAVPRPSNGWQWNDCWKSYICAILQHEGSINLYHGPLGPSATAIITLRRDVS